MKKKLMNPESTPEVLKEKELDEEIRLLMKKRKEENGALKKILNNLNNPAPSKITKNK